MPRPIISIFRRHVKHQTLFTAHPVGLQPVQLLLQDVDIGCALLRQYQVSEWRPVTDRGGKKHENLQEEPRAKTAMSMPISISIMSRQGSAERSTSVSPLSRPRSIKRRSHPKVKTGCSKHFISCSIGKWGFIS